jgi:glycosyltransferase involved in cell wall biosynthesis
VYGEAARLVARPDPALVADAIVELLTDEEARRSLLAQAPDVLNRYRWAEAAASTLAAIEEAARR